jgi:hypothetical protein
VAARALDRNREIRQPPAGRWSKKAKQHGQRAKVPRKPAICFRCELLLYVRLNAGDINGRKIIPE